MLLTEVNLNRRAYASGICQLKHEKPLVCTPEQDASENAMALTLAVKHADVTCGGQWLSRRCRY